MLTIGSLFSGVGGFELGLERLDRLRACGNAVVPQVAEVIGRLIAAREIARAAERAA